MEQTYLILYVSHIQTAFASYGCINHGKCRGRNKIGSYAPFEGTGYEVGNIADYPAAQGNQLGVSVGSLLHKGFYNRLIGSEVFGVFSGFQFYDLCLA